MFAHVARDFLTNKSKLRLNPIRSISLFCPSFINADFIYLEGFLFSLEFIILLFLVVKFFSPNVLEQNLNIDFLLLKETNINPIKQSELNNTKANTLRLFARYRDTIYYCDTYNEANILSLRVLDYLFQPYNQQQWLIKVYESFFPVLEQLAAKELENANLADE